MALKLEIAKPCWQSAQRKLDMTTSPSIFTPISLASENVHQNHCWMHDEPLHAGCPLRAPCELANVAK